MSEAIREDFIGREAELERLCGFFEAGRPVVCVLGPPGAGKTRLARELYARVVDVAVEDLEAPEEGLVAGAFVDLTEAEGLTDLLEEVAFALDVPLDKARDDRARVRQLGRAMRGCGDLLVVLDNAEHLVEVAAPTVSRWAGRGRVRILVTSRERLLIEGEQLLDLGPLGVPEADAGAEATLQSDAARLFVRRARQVRPDFSPGPQDTADIGQIVRRLDGLPLAIELAAARMSLLDTGQLLERLDRWFDLLTRRTRGGGERQATLEAAMGWSWGLLSEAERRAMAQCAIFRGGFDLQAAEAVLDLSAFSGAPPVLDLLQDLREKSLVRALEPGGRLGLYLTVRDYAARHLDASGERPRMERRHAAWYAARGLRWAQAGDADSRRRLTAEVANLRAVVERMSADPEPAGPALGLLPEGPVAPGDHLGACRIVRKIGEGGFATVYEAVHDRLGQRVAVKVLHAGLLHRDDIRRRFVDEARTLARMSHPHVVRVLDIVEERGVLAFVLQYVEGQTLSEVFGEGLEGRPSGFDLEVGLRLMRQVASGVAHAHRLDPPVVHRDLKPSNLFVSVEDGHLVARVMDFGVARLPGRDASLTRTGQFIGTLYYAAPEQILGARGVDARADVYALGAVLYELATGSPPFEADTDFELMRAHIEDAPPPPDAINPGVPAPLSALILRALAKRPEARPASAAEVEEALSELLDAPQRAIPWSAPLSDGGDLDRSTGGSLATADTATSAASLHARRPASQTADPLRHALEAALALDLVLGIQGPLDAFAALLRRALASAEGAAVDPQLELSVRACLARVVRRDGRAAEARDLLEPLVGEAAALGAAGIQGRALVELGTSLWSLGDPEAALARYEAAMALPGVEPLSVVRALHHRGVALHTRGELEEAAALYGRALEQAPSAGDPGEEGAIVGNLGLLQMERGEMEAAARSFERALELDGRANNHRLACAHTANLGALMVLEGHFEAADGHLRRALQLARRLGSARLEAHRRCDLVELRIVQQDLGAAGEQLASAEAIQRDIDDRYIHLRVTQSRVLLRWAGGDPAGALDAAAEALDALEAIGDRRRQALIVGARAALLATAGRPEDAADAIKDARARLAEAPDPMFTRVLDLHEGHLLLADGDVDAALQRLEAALAPVSELDPAPAVNRSFEVRTAAQRLDGALPLERRLFVDAAARGRAVVVGEGGRWFKVAGGDFVDLSRRNKPATLLWALVDKRLAAPGEPLSMDEVVEALWPGESIIHEAATSRVYNTVAPLRKMGLREVIQSSTEGYWLDEGVEVVVV